jgi:CBS-domain-containing membrane protein
MTTPSKTLRVRDIMTEEVFTLVASTSFDDAVRSLLFHQISGAPVMEHGRIVGVVSKTDLLDPRHRARPDGAPTVKDVMTRVVRAVRPGDPVMAAVRLMANEQMHRAVVVDDKGKLVGVVTPMDVLRALVRGDDVQGHDAVFEERKERHTDPAVAFEYVDLSSIQVEE